MILYFAADLIWATRIKATAEQLGLAARPVRNPDMLAQRLADSAPTALIVDLETEQAGVDLIRALRADPDAPRLRVLAFAPHVKKDLMQAARDAGADDVIPRGAFDHDLVDILLRLGAASPSGPPSA